jgi:hypothetical protein
LPEAVMGKPPAGMEVIAVAGTFVATDQAFAPAILSRLDPAAIRNNTMCRFITGVFALLGAF